MVKIAVQKGVITAEQYEEITGEAYVEQEGSVWGIWNSGSWVFGAVAG